MTNGQWSDIREARALLRQAQDLIKGVRRKIDPCGDDCRAYASYYEAEAAIDKALESIKNE